MRLCLRYYLLRENQEGCKTFDEIVKTRNYICHLILVLTLSAVVLIFNIMAFTSMNFTDYLYPFYLTCVTGNSSRLVALSISDRGVPAKQEYTSSPIH